MASGRTPLVLMVPSSFLSTKVNGLHSSNTPFSSTPSRNLILLSHMWGASIWSPPDFVQLPQWLINL